MYVGVSRTNDRVLELDCANGLGCDEVECKVHLLHCLQVTPMSVVGKQVESVLMLVDVAPY